MPQLFYPVLSNNTFSISVRTVSGWNYILEFKDALSQPDWTSLPAIPGDGSVKVLIDSATGVPQRFYRVRQQ